MSAERVDENGFRVHVVEPYRRIGDVVSAGIARRQAASAYLKTLVEIGILDEIKAGREKLIINQALLRLLSDRR